MGESLFHFRKMRKLTNKNVPILFNYVFVGVIASSALNASTKLLREIEKVGRKCREIG